MGVKRPTARDWSYITYSNTPSNKYYRARFWLNDVALIAADPLIHHGILEMAWENASVGIPQKQEVSCQIAGSHTWKNNVMCKLANTQDVRVSPKLQSTLKLAAPYQDMGPVIASDGRWRAGHEARQNVYYERPYAHSLCSKRDKKYALLQV